jgi:type II secretory pathway pseudopilin PulG
MRRFTVRPEPDEGFTLIELVVSAMLAVLVLSIVGGLMISTTSSERIVRSVTSATSSGELVTRSVIDGIRNSGNALSTPAPFTLTNPVGNDQMLSALKIGSGTTATSQCVAWYFSASEHSVRYATSPTAIAAPSSATLATWTLLSTGVTPLSGTGIFTARGSKGITLAFKEDAGNADGVVFQSSATSRTGVTGSIACF